MHIVGIDPGTHRIGYASLTGDRHRVALVRAETITIPTGEATIDRIRTLADTLARYLASDRPDTVAIEKLFFSNNAKTAIAVAEARGIILLTASRAVRSIWEYAPNEVKMTITGSGNAPKSQVRRMIELTLPGTTLPRGDDAIDAIAIALTGIFAPRQS